MDVWALRIQSDDYEFEDNPDGYFTDLDEGILWAMTILDYNLQAHSDPNRGYFWGPSDAHMRDDPLYASGAIEYEAGEVLVTIQEPDSLGTYVTLKKIDFDSVPDDLKAYSTPYVDKEPPPARQTMTCIPQDLYEEFTHWRASQGHSEASE